MIGGEGGIDVGGDVFGQSFDYDQQTHDASADPFGDACAGNSLGLDPTSTDWS